MKSYFYSYLVIIYSLFLVCEVSAKTYTYDPLDRLTSITYADGTRIEYVYDANGNRLRKTVKRVYNEYGFGRLERNGDNNYTSDIWGRLSFASGGTVTNWAWADESQIWLATDGSRVYSADYGWLTPGAYTGWVSSSKIGWIRIHGNDTATAPDGSPWVWSSVLGWVISNRDGSGNYFWSKRLNGWLVAGEKGSLWSSDYGWLSFSAEEGWINTSTLGWIFVGDFEGWVWSPIFGWVIGNGDGTATFFWSDTYGWLAALGSGAVWSYSAGAWMP